MSDSTEEANIKVPFVSVVVPVYNGGRTIRACLEALSSQNYPRDRYEVIVVDNKSSDATVGIASEFDVQVLHQLGSQSSYATRNCGIAHARGEIVAFIDADCVAHDSWLTRLVWLFQDCRVYAVGGQILDDQPTNEVEAFLSRISQFRDYWDADDQFLPVILTGNAAVRKATLDEIGGFAANLYTGGDVDLAWRLQLRYGRCIRYARDAIVYHRHYATCRSMFRQYRRHGFGEIFLDAMYSSYPGYPRDKPYQVHRISRQIQALLTYFAAFVHHAAQYPFTHDAQTVRQPLFWIVAESANILGKLQALWYTRFLSQNPTSRQWQEPLER